MRGTNEAEASKEVGLLELSLLGAAKEALPRRDEVEYDQQGLEVHQAYIHY